MSTVTNKKAPAKAEEKKNESVELVYHGDGSNIIASEAEKMLEALSKTEFGKEITNIFQPELGVQTRIVCIGMSEFADKFNKGEMKSSLKIITEHTGKEVKLCADAQLVNYFEQKTLPHAVGVIYLGMKANKDGFEYRNYQMFELNANSK